MLSLPPSRTLPTLRLRERASRHRWGQSHFHRGPEGPVPGPNVDCSGSCCNAPRGPQCRGCSPIPPIERVLGEIENAWPKDAPSLEDLGDPWEVEDCQMDASRAGDEDWCRYGTDYVPHERDAYGYWTLVGEDAGTGEARDYLDRMIRRVGAAMLHGEHCRADSKASR